MNKIRFVTDWIIPPRLFGLVRNSYCDLVHLLSYKKHQIASRNAIFHNKYHGKRCFVIGNGPSLKQNDLLQLKGELTIVMNYFCENPVLGSWQPTLYCAGDPLSSYHVHELEAMKNVPKKILPTEGYFFPLSVRNLFVKNSIFLEEKTFYLDMCKSFDDWNGRKELSLTGAIPGVQNTAIMGIILAIYMGCKKIYLLGLDHNWLAYKKISLTPHFYKGLPRDRLDPTNSWKYVQNIQAVFIMFSQYEKIHEHARRNGIEIINLTEGSYLDEFPTAKLEDILKG